MRQEMHRSKPVHGMERAVLVCLQLTGRTARKKPPAKRVGNASQASIARQTALRASGGLLSDDFEDDAIAAIEAAPATSNSEDFEEEIAEFRELVRSAGAEVAAEIVQKRDRPDAATLIGPGKVEEVSAVVASTEADIVIFNHDLSPSQLRNLESELPCRVVDRTQLILDIFARHARTREGHLQVELAQLEYLLPRLTGHGKSMSQLGGGIGTRGPGETKLETDRRRIRGRIDHIKEQVEKVRRTRRQQRQRREAVPVPTVALVGYTNAGKSTLFNALTQAGVVESARMFATLDPKLRAITLPSRRRVLLADTVGFVRQLPHTLVTSFRATLEEVEQAEVLLHVRDASSTALERQKADVETVLGELEAGSKPRIEVLNKADLLPASERAGLAQREGGILVSGLKGTGIKELVAAIDLALQSDPMEQRWFRVPQSEGQIVAALDAGAAITERRYEGNLVYLKVVGPASLLGRYEKYQTVEPGRDEKPAEVATGRSGGRGGASRSRRPVRP